MGMMRVGSTENKRTRRSRANEAAPPVDERMQWQTTGSGMSGKRFRSGKRTMQKTVGKTAFSGPEA